MEEKEENLISDEKIVSLYDEIINNLNEDRKECSEMLSNFLNMIMNDGDSSSASKEAAVNLLKIRTEIADKKSKIADFFTRVKLKERDTFPKYLQQNTIKIGVDKNKKREFLKILEKENKNAD